MTKEDFKPYRVFRYKGGIYMLNPGAGNGYITKTGEYICTVESIAEKSFKVHTTVMGISVIGRIPFAECEVITYSSLNNKAPVKWEPESEKIMAMKAKAGKRTPDDDANEWAMGKGEF